jgi:hypothetical protein
VAAALRNTVLMSEPEDIREDVPREVEWEENEPAPREGEEGEEELEVDTEVERPIEGELSPGRLEEGTPESRPVDPRTGSPMST